MYIHWPYITIFRLTVEAAAPLSISAGISDSAFDTQLARDFNGLPAIPATALCGVLRHLYEREQAFHPTWPVVGDVFGQISETHESGSISRVQCTWAYTHDQNDAPVIRLSTRLATDPLLQTLLEDAPITRDMVRIDHKGVAADTGKFERSLVPVGARFTFDVMVGSQDGGENHTLLCDTIVGLFKHPHFKVGGLTHRGFGRLDIVRALHSTLDLYQEDDYEKLKQWPSLDQPCDSFFEPVQKHKIPVCMPSNVITVTMRLSPLDKWRVGKGSRKLSATKIRVHHSPYTEHRILFKKTEEKTTGIALVENGDHTTMRIVVPATSVKGCLLHRTAWHFNRLEGRWADGITPPDPSENLAVLTLFGSENRSDDNSGAGVIHFSDIFYNPKTFTYSAITHNSIDRFTGGVRQGALFTEEVVDKTGSLKTEFTLDTARLKTRLHRYCTPDQVELKGKRVMTAFESAINDLASGVLALGGGSSRGYGYMNGTVSWSNPDWKQEVV